MRQASLRGIASSFAVVLFASVALRAQTLERALIFGSRQLTCETPNEPGTNFEVVFQGSGAQLQYDPGRGWGYEVIYDPAVNPSPYGVRGGYGIFGPMDDSANNRTDYPDTCPEQIYDSFIGGKDFLSTCDAAIDSSGELDVPCDEGDLGDGIPEGMIFRVDVPNGLYRFVAAVGDTDNVHAHRILAEDGGSGPPEDIGDFVVLVHNFDQAQQTIGQVTPAERGEGVFARVGFDDKLPPEGDGVVPDPQFVNMDEEGRITPCLPNSPVLEVTQGYIRIHQLQGNSNDGPGGPRDPNGGDMVVLELWRVESPDIPTGNYVQVDHSFNPDPYGPGDTVTVTLSVSRVSGPATIEETVPDGWTEIDAPAGTVAGQTITFNVTADGDLTYTAKAPGAACTPATFTAVSTPQEGCVSTATGTPGCDPGPCGLLASGAPSEMLIIGPIGTESQDPADPLCDDAGRFATTDYLVGAEGTGGEDSILVEEGDEVFPDFGGNAGGTGVITPTVNFAVNPAINPDGDLGILQVWKADADAQGRINFNDLDNIGNPVDYYVAYGLVYVENTTPDCLPVVFEVGSDDSAKLRVNGQLVNTRPICRGIPAYGAADPLNYAPATLLPGVNVVLLGIVERQGGTDLRLVIRDSDQNPLTDGRVRTSCEPPAAYPSPLPPAVTRSAGRTSYRPGETITVTLDATGISGTTTIADTFSANLTPGDPGDGSFDGNTFRATIANDQQLTYTLVAPGGGCAEVTSDFSGTAAPAGGCTVAIGGLGSLRCDPVCPPPPDAEPAALVAAFYFGSRDLEALFGPVPLESDPGEVYTGVVQVGGDPLSIAYPDPEVELAPGVLYPDEDRPWGYQILYNDPTGLIVSDLDLPAPIHSARGGWEIYGPMDDSPNDRDEFPDALPEEIYDSFIGAKEWLAGQASCSELTVGNRTDPCSTIQDPDGTIFRVDVPNGRYRFVLAVGDADNHHAHRIIAEDGGSGPPQAGAGNHVVLVHNFDQAQYAGDTAEAGGDGVYARVGFDGRIPPQGDEVAPSPVFVNMDENGMDAPLDCPSSPVLEVTQGSIRIHCLQANSNDGPGGARDPNGGDLVVLEIWQVGGPPADRFVRGDVDQSGAVNLTDGVQVLLHLFNAAGLPAPLKCLDAADADDSGTLNLTDGVSVFLFLFRGGSIPLPSPETTGQTTAVDPGDCGTDPTPDEIECGTFPPQCSP